MTLTTQQSSSGKRTRVAQANRCVWTSCRLDKASHVGLPACLKSCWQLWMTQSNTEEKTNAPTFSFRSHFCRKEGIAKTPPMKSCQSLARVFGQPQTEPAQEEAVLGCHICHVSPVLCTIHFLMWFCIFALRSTLPSSSIWSFTSFLQALLSPAQ